MKRYKKEEEGKLEIGLVMYTKKWSLSLDRSLCKGCELCRLVCPRYAITLTDSPDIDGKAVAPLVDVDENKCDYHGICAVVCPFNAIRITTGGKDELPAVKSGVFPVLTRDIEVDRERCEPGCKKCQECCPLGIITVGEDSVDIKKDYCASCPVCWTECPADAISVTKFIEGSILIQPDLCPDGCHKCLDVCPVDALAADEDGKIYEKDNNCIYCGACKLVCPAEGALKIERTAFRHSPVKSGAWNRGLEKITSTKGLMRELTAEGTDKAREAIQNLNITKKGGTV